MSSPLRPRGPLPTRVYWVRRLVVLGLAVVLVVAVAQLLRGGSDASDGDDTAARMSAPASSETASSAVAASGDTGDPDDPDDTGAPGESGGQSEGRQGEKADRKERRKQRLAEPEGPCEPSDVTVTPKVEEVEGGSDVEIPLVLRTEESEACTWEVSAETLSLKITSGSDLIWTSLECPRDLPVEEDVVVRREVPTRVVFTWDARRSDDDCPRETEWALPGTYHVTAAALAGEPTDDQFALVRPTAETVTRTVDPKPRDQDRKADRTKDRRDEDRGRQRDRQRDGQRDGGPGQSPTEHRAGEEGVSEPDG